MTDRSKAVFILWFSVACFGVRVSVTFHFNMFVHISISSDATFAQGIVGYCGEANKVRITSELCKKLNMKNNYMEGSGSATIK